MNKKQRRESGGLRRWGPSLTPKFSKGEGTSDHQHVMTLESKKPKGRGPSHTRKDRKSGKEEHLSSQNVMMKVASPPDGGGDVALDYGPILVARGRGGPRLNLHVEIE